MSRMTPGRFFVTAAFLLVLAAFTGISVGSTELHWSVPVRVLIGQLWPVGETFTATDEFIVWSVRLPRLLVGMISGATLAVAGASLQGLFRNPLAGPGIIGASSGAACGASVALVTGLALQSALWLPLTAFAGAFLAVFLVYGIATHAGRTPVATLILSGIACGAFFNAMVSLLISLRWADWQVASQVLFWIMGGLDSRTWTHVWIALPFAVVGTATIAVCSRSLDLMQMGEESAQSLGADVESTKRWILVGAALLIAASVAVSGVLAFVGLVVPHIVRLIVGPSHKHLLPGTALVGAGFLVFCDVIARTALAPTELRLGVVTSAFGAPFFVWLLHLRRQQMEGGWQ